MDTERMLWAAAQEDYNHALKIAQKAWADLDGEISEVSAETIQAAAATVLIHITKLRGEERIHVKVPPIVAGHPTGKGDIAPPFNGDIPQCPQCGGEMYDNRPKKASGDYKPTSADFTCKDKSCKNAKGFRTGVWETKPNPKGAKGSAQPVAAGGYDKMPGPLVDDTEDDLPF